MPEPGGLGDIMGVLLLNETSRDSTFGELLGDVCFDAGKDEALDAAVPVGNSRRAWLGVPCGVATGLGDSIGDLLLNETSRDGRMGELLGDVSFDAGTDEAFDAAAAL